MAAASLTFPASRAFGRLSYKWVVLMVLIIGLFMSILDQTVVNVALPTIITVFSAPIHTAQLVATAYTLAQAIVIPASGFMMDRYGAKRVWSVSLIAFTTGSALCAFSWSTEALIVFRALQGLGGGMLMPLAMAMIYQVVPVEERGLTMGILGIPLIFGPTLGPVLGGYLVDFVDWRSIFLVNVPIGVLGVFMALTLLRETPTQSRQRFDIWGFLTAAVAFSCSLIALSNGPSDGWTTPYIVVLLALSAVFFVIWVFVELNTEAPLLELRLFKDYIFTMGMVVYFISTVAMFGVAFLLPLYLQDVRGLDAFQTGLLLLPQGAAVGVAMPISGRLFDKLGARAVLIPGLIVLAVSHYLLRTLNVDTSDGTLVLILMLRGVGLGFVLMPLTTAILNTVPMHLLSRGSALASAARQLFASFGIAILITLLTNRQTLHQAQLASQAVMTRPAVERMAAGVDQVAAQHGWTAHQAKEMLVMILNGQVQLKAAVLAYDDTFLAIAAICVLAIACTFFLRSKRGDRAPGAGMAEV